MSVENINIIDIISIDQEGNVVLTISDHLEWDEKNEHLFILQNKINFYLNAIEGGGLFDSYPKAIGRPIIINIVALYSPIKMGFTFLQRTKDIL